MKSAASEQKSLEEKSTVRKIKTTLAARILTKPRSITVYEGEPARFSCDTDGEPVPTVTWLRKGQVISTSSRHQVTTTKYKSTFEISSVQASDEGNYSVVVENADGKQEAQFTLAVQKARAAEKTATSPPIVKSPEPRVKSPDTVKSPKRVKSPEPVTAHPKAMSPTETKPAPAEKAQQLPVSAPPKITQSLKAEASKDIAKLTCAVESSALCAKEVTWYKDGKRLKDNGHFQFHYSADGTYELKIHNLSESDCGEYACEVSGEGGTSKTSFQFTGQSFKSIHEQVSSTSETKKSTQKTDESAEAKKAAQKTAESAEAKKAAQQTAEPTEAKKQEPKSPESISSKPVIVTGLQDISISSDSVAKFTVKVTGEPQPTVAWTKDGKAIVQGGKYKLSKDNDVFILEILKTETSDGGLYACTVTNSAGSVSSSCKLTITAVKDTEAQKVSTQKTTEATSQKKASIQEEISQKALTSEEIKMSEVKSHEKIAIKEEASKVLISEEVKKSAAASLEKSIVHEEVTKTSQASEDVKTHAEIKVLSTQMSINDGQRVTLKANIAGATDVKWVLNGIELTNSEEYRYGVSGSDQTLTIKQASHRDEGVLTCIGKTSQGIVKCQYDLTLSKELSDAPAFISQPRSQNVNEGQNVLFSCEISGEPSPDIEWFKNNLPISVSSNVSVSRSRNVYTLEIRNASVSDSGKYTIKAKNFRGQCSATASLTVFPLVEEPSREVVLKTSGDTSLQGSFSSQSVQMSASKQEASFSSFSSSSASSMTEMKFASMSAQSMSSTQESFVEMSSSSFMGKSSMTQLESSASRMLKAGGRGIPPKIEALPSDISIDEGKVLTVACAFTGEPTPEITWSCRGREIQNQEQQGRFHIENTDDLTTLIIMDVQKQDGGLYTLHLGNEFGSDSATVNINIRSM